jgi:hypothetical protein
MGAVEINQVGRTGTDLAFLVEDDAKPFALVFTGSEKVIRNSTAGASAVPVLGE